MGWENRYLTFLFLVHMVSADLCPEPMVPNGVVTGEKTTNLFFGEVTCNLGYHLVGARNIKCRHGDWSQEELPVCSAIGACPSLPEIQNGRKIPIQGSRGSAYRFKCNRGYKRFGEQRSHCIGDRWSHTHMPSCAKATCDVTGMLDIPYGEGRAMMGGAVYKYRCNLGGEMEGSNTLVCDGKNWNGTVPDCNVGPSEPELQVIVSGNVVTNVKPGDWVLVTCQAKGGNPLPDIGLTLDGVPAGSKDFRNFKNSFTFTASEKDDGKRIVCTAVNKIGTSAASTILQVHTPPTKASISGPKTIHGNDDVSYECSVEGGNPAPQIIWTVRDHLGMTKEVKGEMNGPGLSRMLLMAGGEERIINCLGENNQGIVSHTMHVNTHYLPKTVEISGPTTAAPGEYAHFTCLTTEIFPVPALKWRIEQSGDVYEVNDIDGDVSTEALDDGGVVAFAKIDILIEQGTTHAMVQCSAVVEGLGEKRSKQHNIEVISIEEPDQTLEYKEEEVSSDETKYSNNAEENFKETAVQSKEPLFEKLSTLEGLGERILKQHDIEEPVQTLKYKDDEVSSGETKYSYNSEENKDASEHENKKQLFAKLVTIEKIPEVEEKERSKMLWIPLNPVEDIEDYQNNFSAYANEEIEEAEDEQHFFRPSDIPEAPMLKQEKQTKAAVAQSPVAVSMVYSSSSTLSIQSMLFAVALSMAMLFR
eukprot:GFUD01039280.1.p1 GENE.GFUD01039280.1~~GFUD01039280.1.p1  ORF type:complete len:715 (+),score=216.36 GFUD01039280.1:47-2146(+)